jgi:hypothetical protein
MDVATGICGSNVVGKLRVGDAHVVQHALSPIDRTGGDGDLGNVALGVICRHAQDQPCQRSCGDSLAELAQPFAGLNDDGVGGVFRDVCQRERAVDGRVSVGGGVTGVVET